MRSRRWLVRDWKSGLIYCENPGLKPAGHGFELHGLDTMLPQTLLAIAVFGAALHQAAARLAMEFGHLLLSEGLAEQARHGGAIVMGRRQ